MVKNTGGNKSKKQARKSVVVTTATQNVRYIAEEGEMYAIITKIFGGKTCQVMCHDGVSRRCTIRKKFTMSRRGVNMFGLGTWLMIGLYDWEKRSDENQTCDLLEVYSPGEKEKLKQTVSAKLLHHIIEVTNEFDGIKNSNEFLFSDTLVEAGGLDDDESDDTIIDNDANDDDNDNDNDNDSIPIPVPVPVPVSKKESLMAHNDWMKIEVDDI
jgi:hypothetical protein